jgi:hypothetical protein
MRRTRSGCCARAASGHDAAVPTITVSTNVELSCYLSLNDRTQTMLLGINKRMVRFCLWNFRGLSGLSAQNAR